MACASACAWGVPELAELPEFLYDRSDAPRDLDHDTDGSGYDLPRPSFTACEAAAARPGCDKPGPPTAYAGCG
jgi:hypothetical protein